MSMEDAPTPGGLGAEGQEGGPPGAAHGGRGGRGGQGGPGAPGTPGVTGARGPRGLPYSSVLTRHLVKAFVAVVAGLALAFGLVEYRTAQTTDRIDRTIERIDRVAIESCEAGNKRSDSQRESVIQQQKVTQSLDLQKLLGIDAQQEADFKRLSAESSERQLDGLPYLDCSTGAPTLPSPTTTTP